MNHSQQNITTEHRQQNITTEHRQQNITTGTYNLKQNINNGILGSELGCQNTVI
jgi:hypothetical protein